jgi:hypothetical protein
LQLRHFRLDFQAAPRISKNVRLRANSIERLPTP